MKPTGLLCEYAVNPLGIDEHRPRFSWVCPDAGGPQTAYQILVARSLEELKENNGTVWNSGRVESARNHAVCYDGAELCSRELLFWKVRLWDAQGRPTGFSSPAHFEMALLQPSDWLPYWIGWPGGRPGMAAYFRCAFALDALPARARLYICGLGLYEAFVNGTRMEGRLQPAVSDASRRVYYNVFDVTGALLGGENVLAVTVGNGWHGRPALAAQLEADFSDGRRLTISTRNDPVQPAWFTAAGPVRCNSLFDGETFDARFEKSGWNRPGYDEMSVKERTEAWMPACRVPQPGGVLRAQHVESIAVIRTLSGSEPTEPRLGVFVFDFGVNHAGWGRLEVCGSEGTRIRLKYGETLQKDGTVCQENLRTAAALDTYVLKGGGDNEVWEPRFTYHGYRYVQVEGWPGRPGPGNVTSQLARTDAPRRGEFFCSRPLLNKIHEMVVRTEESNLHGIPTDCPQRDERMGWSNDMVARSEELLYNFDAARLLEKFVCDIADTQDPDTGAIADVAPHHWGYHPADPICMSYLLIPGLLHAHYGDTRCLERHHPGMVRWVDYLWSRAEGGLLAYSHFGDWAPPAAQGTAGSIGDGAISSDTPGELVSTAFLYQSLVLLAQTGRVLGKESEAGVCEEKAAKVQEAFQAKFWNTAIGGYGSGNQACNAIALYFRLVPDSLRAGVVERLASDVRARGCHLTTGNLATKYLLEVLSTDGCGSLALVLATQTTYPSWGFMLERGATTLWERWEELSGGGMNSHNHPMFGSVGSWLYRHVAGLRFGVPGRDGLHLEFHPPVLDELHEARARVQTVHGPAAISWRRSGDCHEVDIEVPWNCSASLHCPGLAPRPLTCGTHAFSLHQSSESPLQQ